MRYAPLLLLVPALLASGCSMMLGEVGLTYDGLETREQARQLFGKPIASGTENGNAFEEFHTRRLIRDISRSGKQLEWLLRTYGLSELYFVPLELAMMTRTTIFGHTVRVTYDVNGRVTEREVVTQTTGSQRASTDDTQLSPQKSP